MASGRVVAVAVDNSANSKDAFNWYLENVKRDDDKVVVIHCPEIPHLPYITFSSGLTPPVEEWQSLLKDIHEKTNSLGQDYATICRSHKLKFRLTGESHKNPGEGIVAAASETGAQFIVMGSRGLGQVKKVLMGSVSDYVTRHSTIPVLIVPAKRPNSH